jgi:hypothetical protein
MLANDDETRRERFEKHFYNNDMFPKFNDIQSTLHDLDVDLTLDDNESNTIDTRFHDGTEDN